MEPAPTSHPFSRSPNPDLALMRANRERRFPCNSLLENIACANHIRHRRHDPTARYDELANFFLQLSEPRFSPSCAPTVKSNLAAIRHRRPDIAPGPFRDPAVHRKAATLRRAIRSIFGRLRPSRMVPRYGPGPGPRARV
jgi:hypothetical protein